MIPGQTYGPQEVLRVAWRYRRLILLPFVVVSVATLVGSHYLPNRYRSETLILVVPQRVPEQYVHATVTTRIEDRLQSIAQQILSRTRLERIVLDFNLYVQERRTGIMEDIVDRMRRDIDVQIVKGDAFRVAFTGSDPRTVMKVTERLASLFIDESLRDRENLADGTNQFLEAQLQDARRQLIEREKKLETYRRQHDGELPTQVDANLQAIRTTELQLQALGESLNRDRDQKMLVERQIADAGVPDGESVAQAPPTTASDGSVSTGSASQQLSAARQTLQSMQIRMTDAHPDVIRMKRVIRDLEKKAEADALEQPVSDASAPPSTPADRTRRNRRNELEAQRVNLDRNVAAKQAEEKRLRAEITRYQQRVAAAPTRESELVELTRDYQTLQGLYTNMLAKREDSKVAANLERRQIGEIFKVLDAAHLPEKPISPNRLLINLAGALAGLALGLGLAALLEYRDSSLRTNRDVAVVLAVPVLAFIPMMMTAADRKLRRRRNWVMSMSTAAAVLTAFAVLVWKLRG